MVNGSDTLCNAHTAKIQKLGNSVFSLTRKDTTKNLQKEKVTFDES